MSMWRDFGFLLPDRHRHDRESPITGVFWSEDLFYQRQRYHQPGHGLLWTAGFKVDPIQL